MWTPFFAYGAFVIDLLLLVLFKLSYAYFFCVKRPGLIGEASPNGFTPPNGVISPLGVIALIPSILDAILFNSLQARHFSYWLFNN